MSRGDDAIFARKPLSDKVLSDIASKVAPGGKATSRLYVPYLAVILPYGRDGTVNPNASAQRAVRSLRDPPFHRAPVTLLG